MLLRARAELPPSLALVRAVLIIYGSIFVDQRNVWAVHKTLVEKKLKMSKILSSMCRHTSVYIFQIILVQTAVMGARMTFV